MDGSYHWLLTSACDDKKEILLEDLLDEVMRFVPIDAILLDKGFDSAKVIYMLKKNGIGKSSDRWGIRSFIE